MNFWCYLQVCEVSLGVDSVGRGSLSDILYSIKNNHICEKARLVFCELCECCQYSYFTSDEVQQKRVFYWLPRLYVDRN